MQNSTDIVESSSDVSADATTAAASATAATADATAAASFLQSNLNLYEENSIVEMGQLQVSLLSAFDIH